MKKVHSLFSVLVVLLIACNAPVVQNDDNLNNSEPDKIKSDLEKSNYIGDINSINEIIYYADTTKGDDIGELYNRNYYKYNMEGYHTLKEFYGSEDNLIHRKIIEIDENGYIKSTEVYDGFTGDLTSVNTYNYNDNGEIEEIEEANEDGETLYKRNYEYNSDGKILVTKMIFVEDDEVHFKTEYVYNNDGELSELRSFDYISDYYRVNRYEYDTEGRLINTKVYTDDEQLIQDLDYEYSFDEKGNWIKRIESNNGRLTYITVREIEYR